MKAMFMFIMNILTWFYINMVLLIDSWYLNVCALYHNELLICMSIFSAICLAQIGKPVLFSKKKMVPNGVIFVT